MKKEFKDKIFKGLIYSFLILYLLTASVSFYHCIEFCQVGNPLFLSVVMSFAFEVGLALTLFSILITDENKNNIVSWVLMTLLTCVQVMGNIYSVEKYMELSNNNFYTYIQNGFLHWFTEDMSQRDVMSIIAIILGALLPFVALLMTSMVARNWKNQMSESEEEQRVSEITPSNFNKENNDEIKKDETIVSKDSYKEYLNKNDGNIDEVDVENNTQIIVNDETPKKDEIIDVIPETERPEERQRIINPGISLFQPL